MRRIFTFLIPLLVANIGAFALSGSGSCTQNTTYIGKEKVSKTKLVGSISSLKQNIYPTSGKGFNSMITSSNNCDSSPFVVSDTSPFFTTDAITATFTGNEIGHGFVFTAAFTRPSIAGLTKFLSDSDMAVTRAHIKALTYYTISVFLQFFDNDLTVTYISVGDTFNRMAFLYPIGNDLLESTEVFSC